MTKSWNDLADLQEPDYSSYNNLVIIDANNLSIDGSNVLTTDHLVQTLFGQFNHFLNLMKLPEQ